MNKSEELFRAISKDADYFFVELPRESTDKARYHAGLLLAFLVGAWAFVQVVDKLKLQKWLPDERIIVVVLTTVALLSLGSLMLVFVALLSKSHFSPDYEQLLAQHEKESGATPDLLPDSGLGSYWIDKMIKATRKNHAIHERRMHFFKVSHCLFIVALGVSALVPILMLKNIVWLH